MREIKTSFENGVFYITRGNDIVSIYSTYEADKIRDALGEYIYVNNYIDYESDDFSDIQ